MDSFVVGDGDHDRALKNVPAPPLRFPPSLRVTYLSSGDFVFEVVCLSIALYYPCGSGLDKSWLRSPSHLNFALYSQKACPHVFQGILSLSRLI